MRLSGDKVNAIREETEKLDPEAEIFLYGSRADDEAMGGDIDVYVKSKRIRYEDSLRLRVRIKDRIGWQRLDLTVADGTDPLGEVVLREGVRL